MKQVSMPDHESTLIHIHTVLINMFTECNSAYLNGSLFYLIYLGEALGAIGNLKVLDLLKEYSEDPVIEVW